MILFLFILFFLYCTELQCYKVLYCTGYRLFRHFNHFLQSLLSLILIIRTVVLLVLYTLLYWYQVPGTVVLPYFLPPVVLVCFWERTPLIISSALS